MKIALTADLHLKQQNTTPDRYNALADIIKKLALQDINNLIIAGDLFDKEAQNYSDFEKFCSIQQIKSENMNFYIIPGNHDFSINQNYFTLENIKVITSPLILNPDENSESVSFLFIPFTVGKSIGEVLSEQKDKLQNLQSPFVLVGHGDYIAGLKNPNPYEPGIYMPLTRQDIDFYNPQKVFLGHIHKKVKLGKVYYPGSPCGLDINETGKRSFLIIDTDSLEVTEQTVETDYIYINETLIAIPALNEEEYTKEKISQIIKKYEISETDISKVKIRLQVKGYTSDKANLLKIIKENLVGMGFNFYKDEQPDLSEVYVLDDPERIAIAKKVKEEIEKLQWDNEYTSKDKILEKALKLIFC